MCAKRLPGIRMPSKRLVAGACLVLVTVVAMALVTGSSRLVGEKVLTSLVMPMGIQWLLSLLVLALAWKSQQRAVFWLAFGLSLLIYLGGNGFLAKQLMHRREREFDSIRPLQSQPFDVVIVLGGGTSVRPNGEPQLSFGGDRVFLAAEMFHAGKTREIICTGSRMPGLDRRGVDPGRATVDLLKRIGVPEGQLRFVGGRTTYEEMRQLKEELRPESRVGLITSAWHMRRALRLARTHELNVEPLPCDFASPPDLRPTFTDFIPNSRSAEYIRLSCKETLAWWVGR